MFLRQFYVKLFWVTVLSILLVACSGSRDKYDTINPKDGGKGITLGGKPKSKLELPPDLVNTSNATIVQLEEYTEANVVPETIGVTVQKNGDERWLEIDAPAEEVWPKLVRYWGLLGAKLVVNDPKTGIMETDWVHQEKDDDKKKGGFAGTNLLISLLVDITDQETSLDKYTMRVERQNGNQTLVYLSHRGSKKIQIGQSSIASHLEWEWVETEQDPEKVRIVLQSVSYSFDPESA